MSNKPKKRKVSEEPVLQDYTVTSFSDLNPDGAAPSDTSLFEEIKNYNFISETTFNKTDSINIKTGPYPSDSSLDSICKPESKGKPSKHKKLFQRHTKKESVEGSLFDLCLKNSFSETSMEKVHKPFRKRGTKDLRQSLFDSDLESVTPIKDSPFKKPLQRKSKFQQKQNLFDSLIKDSNPNTPVDSLQRNAKKKSTLKITDGITSDCSINQQSPSQNVITRMKKRLTRKKNESNIFDEEFDSSQSDTSMTSKKLGLKRKTVTKNCSKSSNMFDDLLDSTDNESLAEIKSQSKKFLHPANCSKSSNMFDDLLNGTDNESLAEIKSQSKKSLNSASFDSNDSNGNPSLSFSLAYNVDSDKSENTVNASCHKSQIGNPLIPDSYRAADGLNKDFTEYTSVNGNKVAAENLKSIDNFDSEEVNFSEVQNQLSGESGKPGKKLESNDGLQGGPTMSLNELEYKKLAENEKRCNNSNEVVLENQTTFIDTPKQDLEENTLEPGNDKKTSEQGNEQNEMPEKNNAKTMKDENKENVDREKLEQDKEILEQEDENIPQENEDKETLEQESEDEETLEQESEDEETLEQESEDEETLEQESENEETLQQESEDEETLEQENEETLEQASEDEESEQEYEESFGRENAETEQELEESLDQETEHENKLEHTKESEGETALKQGTENEETIRSIMIQGDNETIDDVAPDQSDMPFDLAEPKRDTDNFNVSKVYESNLVESIHIEAVSLDCRTSLSYPRKMSLIGIPKMSMVQHEQISITTPDASFKDMLSSTPKVKGKRVSFFVEEDIDRPSIKNNLQINQGLAKEAYLAEKINKTFETTLTQRKSSLRSSKMNNDSRITCSVTAENSMNSRQRRVSFKLDKLECLNKQSNSKSKDKPEHLTRNDSENCYSSVSLDSLVYAEGSESRTLESDSVFIDIHPSRGKSSSSSNIDSFSRCKNKSDIEKSTSKLNFKSLKNYDNLSNDSKMKANTSESSQTQKSRSLSKSNYSVGDKTIENTEGEEYFYDADNEIVSRDECETSGNVSQENSSDISRDERETSGNVTQEHASDVENDEKEQTEKQNMSQYENTYEVEESEVIVNEETEFESEEPNEITDFQDSEHHSVESSVFDSCDVDNEVSGHEQDENLNPDSQTSGGFKKPMKIPKQKKKIRTSSLFLEKPLNVPSKSKLRDILHKIPFSELKKNKQKQSQNCISKEQMQQYEIEEGLLRNQQKNKTSVKIKSFSGSGKLKRPKKWVTPKLYDFLISKLKPQFGIRSRIQAEELVVFLAEHVECIKKKKELIQEDVDKMKIELARLCIVRTHWDFFQFVSKYFDYHFKEKMYPSLPGNQSAFEFGPTNVMEDILMEK